MSSSVVIDSSPSSTSSPPLPPQSLQPSTTSSRSFVQPLENIINTLKRKTFDLISPKHQQKEEGQQQDINNNNSRSLKRSKYYYQQQYQQQNNQHQQSNNSIFSTSSFSTKSLFDFVNTIPAIFSSFSLGRSNNNNSNNSKKSKPVQNNRLKDSYSYYNRVDNKNTIKRINNNNTNSNNNSNNSNNNNNNSNNNSSNKQDLANSIRLKKLLYRPKQKLPYHFQGEFNDIHLQFAPSPIKQQYEQQQEQKEQHQKQQIFNNSHYKMKGNDNLQSTTTTDSDQVYENGVNEANFNNTTTKTTTTTTTTSKKTTTPKKATSSKVSFIDSIAVEKQNQSFKGSLDRVINQYKSSLYLSDNDDDNDNQDQDDFNNSILSSSYNVSLPAQSSTPSSIFKVIKPQPSYQQSPFKTNNQSFDLHTSHRQQQHNQSFENFFDQDNINNNNNNELSVGDLNTSFSSSITAQKYNQSFNNNNSNSKFNSTYKSNLISSLRPTKSLNDDVVLRIEKEKEDSQFKQQVEIDLKKQRDDEISSLLHKLDSLSKSNKWNILKQIEEKMEKERNAKPILKPLAPKDEQTIDNALKRGNDEEVLSKIGSNSCTRYDIRLLAPTKWLNDEVINFYILILNTRQANSSKYLKCHFFNTFFYQLLCNNNGTYNYDRVKKWTNSIDIFSFDKVIMPIHLGNHWCCAVINFKDKRIEYFDSLLGNNPECISKLRRYLQDEMKNRKKEGIIDLNEFENVTDKDIPTQQNGYDCGVFMCKFAEFSSRGAKLNFTQQDITQYRRRMVLEILNKQTLE